MRSGPCNAGGYLQALALLSAVLSGQGGCQSAESHDAPAQPAVAASDSTARVTGRRPPRRYFLERTAERCEVFAVQGEAKTVLDEATCPVDLEVGERLRLSGKACFRESARRGEEPVVCPDSLRDAPEDEARKKDAGGKAK